MKLGKGLLILLYFAVSAAQGQTAPTMETGDFNFDGHPDYRRQSERPGNQCGWWEYYLYDPASGAHRPVETNFCRERFDAEKRLVVTRINGGMTGLIYAIRHFRWDGLELVPVFVEKQDYDAARRLFVRTRVTNMVGPGGPTVLSEILSPKEAGADPESPD